jgi:starch-binding outer membrane protein, SusD/RagB family
MRLHRNGSTTVAAGRSVIGALAALTLVLSTACNSLLTVDNPGRVPVEALDDPSLMPILEAAAIQTLQCGLNNFATTGAMLSGEFLSSNGFVNNHPWEWRGAVEIRNEPGSCNNGRATTSMGFYTPLQQARFQLDDTFDRLEAFTDAQVPNRARFQTEMRAYAGYAYLLLGEGMCEMTIDNGPKMTKAEVWKIAESRFTDAIARATAMTDATAGTSLKNMALVGRARARLDLGDLPGAAADAALVPQGFVRTATFSETNATRENRWYNLNIRNDYLSVADGYRNLTVGGVADPRVKVTDMKKLGNDNVTPMWQQTKYTGSGAAPEVIASWNEAQLILAEAVGGQAGIDALNRVRAANGVTTPLVYAGGDITDIVIEERRRQLFAEGQRYVDMLRKNLPFPTGTNGANRKGQVYGPVTCVPLPNVETQNNPNFKT